MNPELEKQIYEIDPVFFRQKGLDMTQTCMCWGIECGDGWFKPIKEFVTKVKILNEILKPVNFCIVASQIKSKWADFTCYWNIDVLDDKVQNNDDSEALVDAVYEMMTDAANSCEEKCSHTCEICGKYDSWEESGEIIECGSWLTVKCLACAQKRQREEGKITNFRDGFLFLSPFVKEPVIIDGKCFPTVIGAHYGTLYPEHEGTFIELKTPSEVQAVAMNNGLCSDDEKAFENMRNVLRIRYREGKSRERLISTEGLEIVQSNHNHENKWGSCWCKDCNGKGENHYGKILMEIRDEILKEQKAEQ